MMKEEYNDNKSPIAIQFLDNLSQRILKEQTHLMAKLSTMVPIHRNALETGVLALAAFEPKLVGFFEHLLFPEPEKDEAPEYICALSPMKLIHQNNTTKIDHKLDATVEATFWDLDALVRKGGMLLLGWHRSCDVYHCLNPPNKKEKLKWTDKDLILVAHDHVHVIAPKTEKSLFAELSDDPPAHDQTPTDLDDANAEVVSSPSKLKSRKYMSFSEPLDGEIEELDI